MLKPDRIAGAGGLRSRHDAMLAGESGADYVMFGEPDRRGRRLPFDELEERLLWWAELLEMPCVGYADHPDEVAPLARTGADFVALGEWIWTEPQGAAAAIAAAAENLAAPVAAMRPRQAWTGYAWTFGCACRVLPLVSWPFLRIRRTRRAGAAPAPAVKPAAKPAAKPAVGAESAAAPRATGTRTGSREQGRARSGLRRVSARLFPHRLPAGGAARRAGQRPESR